MKNKIEHAVVYAYDYEAHIGYFDTAEDAERKVSNMMYQVQAWKIQFCENVSGSQDDICRLRDRVQNALDLLQSLSVS